MIFEIFEIPEFLEYLEYLANHAIPENLVILDYLEEFDGVGWLKGRVPLQFG